MNYLEISLRTYTILGGLMTIAIIATAVWLAYKYSK